MVNHPKRSKRTQKKVSATTTPSAIENHDHDYSGLLRSVQLSFYGTFEALQPKFLFRTDETDLNNVYLYSMPDEVRQIHNCHACKRFLERFGNLVAIDDGGSIVPVMWWESLAPDFYKITFAALRQRVGRAKITGPFINSAEVLGTPETGEWKHMSVKVPRELLYKGVINKTHEVEAQIRERRINVMRALADFKPDLLDEALRILNGNVVSSSEKFIEPVRWLRKLHDRPRGRNGDNLIWKAVAEAPEGYCHPRASVVGSLLEDLQSGMRLHQVAERFNAKVQPIRYQRPTAAPTEGNIKQAERIVSELGIEPSLHRRFARLDEVKLLWQPALDVKTGAGGVFDHLPIKGEKPTVGGALPQRTMTWRSFSERILPEVRQMEIYVPSYGPFSATVTAVNSDVPPILKWDWEDERNPFSTYTYQKPSPCGQWQLASGWNKVTGIMQQPNLWGNRPMPELGGGLMFLIEEACDTNDDSGNGLFPVLLKQELYQVRATIEAYSKLAKVEGRNRYGLACGLTFNGGQSNSVHIRVNVSGNWDRFLIDRWD
jgi:hypothetical protein